jgi:OmpA-OmpF porin, OOP family
MIKKIITTGLFSVSTLSMINVNATELSTSSLTLNAKNDTQPTLMVRKHEVVSRKIKPKQSKQLKRTCLDVDQSTGYSSLNTQLAQSNGPANRFYINGQIGYADTAMGSKLSGLSNSGLAGHLAVGYQLNKLFGLELGYLQLQDEKTKAEGVNAFLNQHAIDLTAKALLPITNNVGLYGKLGVAYLTTKIEANYGNGITPVNNAASIASRKWAPEVAVGMSYDITSNITVDTSLTHIQPLGSNRPGNIDFLAVGLGYSFG